MLLLFTGTALAETLYPVRQGDSLFKIAKRFDTSVSQLRDLNGLGQDTIYPWQVLRIPDGDYTTYNVEYGDSLYVIASRVGTSITLLKAKNDLTTDSIEAGSMLVLPTSSAEGESAPVVAVSSGPGAHGYSASDLDLLARLVEAEAAGEPYEGLVAVAATVLNRLRDSRYPNTIQGVVYQVVDGRYYQYSPVLDGRINRPASQTSRDAVEDALHGWDPSLGANGFYNPAKTTNQWVRSHPVTTTIGNHVFFRY